MKAAYKWRITSTRSLYLFDPYGGTDPVIRENSEVDEAKEITVKNKVASLSKDEYCNQFTKIANILKGDKNGKNLQMLDCDYYYDLKADGCIAKQADLSIQDVNINATASVEWVEVESQANVNVDVSGSATEKNLDFKFKLPKTKEYLRKIDKETENLVIIDNKGDRTRLSEYYLSLSGGTIKGDVVANSNKIHFKDDGDITYIYNTQRKGAKDIFATKDELFKYFPKTGGQIGVPDKYETDSEGNEVKIPGRNCLSIGTGYNDSDNYVIFYGHAQFNRGSLVLLDTYGQGNDLDISTTNISSRKAFKTTLGTSSSPYLNIYANKFATITKEEEKNPDGTTSYRRGTADEVLCGDGSLKKISELGIGGVSGDYLPLSGGTVTGETTFKEKVLGEKGFFETSDIRLKNIIGDAKFDIDKILNLSIVYFTFKDSKEYKPQLGVIAQEIAEICPEIVSKDKDGYLSVDYAKLSLLSLYCIKDLYKKIKN